MASFSCSLSGTGTFYCARKDVVAAIVWGSEYEVQGRDAIKSRSVWGESRLSRSESLQQLQRQPGGLPQHDHDLVTV